MKLIDRFIATLGPTPAEILAEQEAAFAERKAVRIEPNPHKRAALTRAINQSR